MGRLTSGFTALAVTATTITASIQDADAAIIMINATGIDELSNTVSITTTIDTNISPLFSAPQDNVYESITGFSGTIGTTAFTGTSGNFSIFDAIGGSSDRYRSDYNLDASAPILDLDFVIESHFNTTSNPDVTGIPAIINDPSATVTRWDYRDASGTTIAITPVSLSASTVSMPEPSSTALLGLGGLALLMRRNRPSTPSSANNIAELSNG